MVRSDETEWKFSRMSKKGWGSDPLAVDAVNAFASMEASCTIRLIGTFEPNLIFCHEDDLVHKIGELERYRPFDHIPVKRDSLIVGLLSVVNLRNNLIAPGNTVSHHMKQIDDNILIASDSGVLSFIEQADKNPCRLILRNMKIDGIVVLPDLQKLPVRSSIFFLITHLELLMATTLRSKFNGNDDWLSLLSSNRQSKIEEKWNNLSIENTPAARCRSHHHGCGRAIRTAGDLEWLTANEDPSCSLQCSPDRDRSRFSHPCVRPAARNP
jgi:predicted transcriptional regulator